MNYIVIKFRINKDELQEEVYFIEIKNIIENNNRNQRIIYLSHLLLIIEYDSPNCNVCNLFVLFYNLNYNYLL